MRFPIGFSFHFPEKVPPEHPSKTQKKGFCCFKCQQIFSNKRLLKHHLNSKHFNRKRFQCKMCPKSFVQDGTLSRHMNAVHTQKRKYECAKCDNVFYYREYLTYHLASKHGEGVYRCNECHKICPTKQKLQIHLNSTLHSNEKHFQCPIKSCLKKFTQKNALSKHIRANHA